MPLAQQRTGRGEDAAESRRLFSSTPKTEHGEINRWFLKGNQEKLFITCGCGAEHMMDWACVKFDDPSARDENGEWIIPRAAEVARYECPTCKKRYDQAEFDVMKLTQKFKPTAVAQVPGVVSYWVCPLAGQWPQNTMASIVAGFLSAKASGFGEDMQNWWNSVQGLPIKDTLSTVNAEKLKGRCLPYARGTLPSGVKCDLIIVAYGRHRSSVPER